jgi:hypothetical protein
VIGTGIRATARPQSDTKLRARTSGRLDRTVSQNREQIGAPNGGAAACNPGAVSHRNFALDRCDRRTSTSARTGTHVASGGHDASVNQSRRACPEAGPPPAGHSRMATAAGPGSRAPGSRAGPVVAGISAGRRPRLMTLERVLVGMAAVAPASWRRSPPCRPSARHRQAAVEWTGENHAWVDSTTIAAAARRDCS